MASNDFRFAFVRDIHMSSVRAAGSWLEVNSNDRHKILQAEAEEHCLVRKRCPKETGKKLPRLAKEGQCFLMVVETKNVELCSCFFKEQNNPMVLQHANGNGVETNNNNNKKNFMCRKSRKVT